MNATAAASAERRRGRPPVCSRELAVRIIEMRQNGHSYARICTVLNAEHVLTPAGGSRWMKSHVDRLLHTRWVQEIIEDLDVTHSRGPSTR